MDDERVKCRESMCIMRNDKGDWLSQMLLDYVLDVHVDVTNNAAQVFFFSKERQWTMTGSSFQIERPSQSFRLSKKLTFEVLGPHCRKENSGGA